MGKEKHIRPNGGFDGDLPWYKVKNHLKQIPDLEHFLGGNPVDGRNPVHE